MSKLLWVPLTLALALAQGVAAGDFLALRGDHTGGKQSFNTFRNDLAKPGVLKVATQSQYLEWKNSCRSVTPVVAGHALEMPEPPGFLLVSPFIIKQEDEGASFLAVLREALRPPSLPSE